MFEYKVDRKRLNFDLWIAVSLITMLFFHLKMKHRSALYHHFFLFFVCAMKQEIETSANLLDIQFNFIILYEVFRYCCCEKRECFLQSFRFTQGARKDCMKITWSGFVWCLKRVNRSVLGVNISRNL